MDLYHGSSPLEEFQAMHEKNFAPIFLIVKAFAEQSGLTFSHSFDRDPMSPHACLFCEWPANNNKPDQRFIRICVQHPLAFCSDFYVDAAGKRFSRQRWTYSNTEGEDKLKNMLLMAKIILDRQEE